MHTNNRDLPRPGEGNWSITDTIVSDRKNLFWLDIERSFHVATLQSGSRTDLARFDASLALIEAAPTMFRALAEALAEINTLPDPNGVKTRLAPILAAAIKSASTPHMGH